MNPGSLTDRFVTNYLVKPAGPCPIPTTPSSGGGSRRLQLFTALLLPSLAGYAATFRIARYVGRGVAFDGLAL